MPRIDIPRSCINFPNWVIFDLDGTLADLKHRLHFIQNDCPDWDSFNMACDKDMPIEAVKNLLDLCRLSGRNIAILTGRMETAKEKTKKWLEKHKIEYELLCMRAAGDHRSDTIVKKEMFEKHFKKENVWFVVDDRDKVVDMWRELELVCLQCQKGDY